MLAGFGLIAGFFGGLLGLGGGWIMTPLLSIMGMPATFCVGTSFAQMIGTSGVSFAKHMQKGRLKFDLAFAFAIPILAGVQLGQIILQYLRTHNLADATLRYLFIAMLLILTAGVVRRLRLGEGSIPKVALWMRQLPLRGPNIPIDHARQLPLYLSTAVGLFAGTVSGVLGVGGAVIILPTLTAVIGLHHTVAVAISAFCVFVGSCYGTTIYAITGQVEFEAAGMILLGSLAGSYLGASLISYANPRFLRILFGSLLMTTASSLLLKELSFDAAAHRVLFISAGCLGGFACLSLILERLRQSKIPPNS